MQHAAVVSHQGNIISVRTLKAVFGIALGIFAILMLLGSLGKLNHGWQSVILVGILVCLYPFWVLEHRLPYNKMGPTIIAAVMAWLLVGVSADKDESDHIWESFEHSFLEVFLIFFYVLIALKLVKRLSQNEGFTGMRYWLIEKGGTSRRTFMLMGVLTFFMSAIFDNLTVTVIMLQVAVLIFVGRNLVRSGAMVVGMANVGGAWSPIGDVTTIMLWLEGKVSTTEIITLGLWPCLAYGVVFMWIISRGVNEDEWQQVESGRVTLSREQRIANPIIAGSFLLPPLLSVTLGAHPIIGLLAGLGITYIVTATLNEEIREREVGAIIDSPQEALVDDQIDHDTLIGEVYSPSQSAMSLHVGHLLDEEEWYGLWFIAGALMLVAAFVTHGLIADFANILFTQEPTDERIIVGFVLMGPISALIDNIPLTAAAMDMVATNKPMLWVLLAINVGTGGTLTSFGSAAGVIAMGMVAGLNFVEYAKVSFLAALAGSVTMLGAWYAMWVLF